MLLIELPIKPISLNQCFVQIKGRRVPSKTYTSFKKTFNEHIIKFIPSIIEFFDFYDEKTHEIHAEIDYFTPDLYTKNKTISKNSSDLGNVEKALNDLIFKLQNKADDSAITSLKLRKLYANSHKVIIKYQIVTRN